MAFKKTNRKAQAAIEFLMTYGWMLLVVLIVGALIFSFVDFGGLLPNSITMSSANLQPIVGDSYVQVTDPALGTGTILIAFRYNGAQPIEFGTPANADFQNSDYNITYNFGDSSCGGDLFPATNALYNNDITSGLGSADNTLLRFRSGHAGYVQFTNCPGLNQLDVVEGTIKVSFKSTQTGAKTPVFGDVRLTKVE